MWESAAVTVWVGLAGTCLPAVAQDPATPGPQERTLRWVAQLDSPERAEREGAMRRLTEEGRAAVVPLIEVLKGADRNDCTPGQLAAVRVLYRLGEAAAPAVPQLAALVPHADGGANVTLILALNRIAPYAGDGRTAIRDAVVRLLLASPVDVVRAFANDQSYARLMALRAFARTSLRANDPGDQLIWGLGDPNPFVRELAIELVTARGIARASCIAALARIVSEAQPDVAKCEGVGHPDSSLLRMVVCLDNRLHRQAALALAHLAPDDPRSVTAHAWLLGETDPEVVRRSVLALGRIGPAAAPAVPALIAALRSGVLPVRREAAATLGRIGPAAVAATAPLRERLTDEDGELAERARVALRRIVN